MPSKVSGDPMKMKKKEKEGKYDEEDDDDNEAFEVGYATGRNRVSSGQAIMSHVATSSYATSADGRSSRGRLVKYNRKNSGV